MTAHGFTKGPHSIAELKPGYVIVDTEIKGDFSNGNEHIVRVEIGIGRKIGGDDLICQSDTQNMEVHGHRAVEVVHEVCGHEIVQDHAHHLMLEAKEAFGILAVEEVFAGVFVSMNLILECKYTAVVTLYETFGIDDPPFGYLVFAEAKTVSCEPMLDSTGAHASGVFWPEHFGMIFVQLGHALCSSDTICCAHEIAETEEVKREMLGVLPNSRRQVCRVLRQNCTLEIEWIFVFAVGIKEQTKYQISTLGVSSDFHTDSKVEGGCGFTAHSTVFVSGCRSEGK